MVDVRRIYSPPGRTLVETFHFRYGFVCIVFSFVTSLSRVFVLD